MDHNSNTLGDHNVNRDPADTLSSDSYRTKQVLAQAGKMATLTEVSQGLKERGLSKLEKRYINHPSNPSNCIPSAAKVSKPSPQGAVSQRLFTDVDVNSIDGNQRRNIY